ncbi:aldehyde dehydrogenase family protein [Bradyrhizobium sp. JYMT SZCCT0428]|uniref:aldehyde dehydrogenase family protein n=1 Tax=Bradyrhizobium sp. JYMT SZCCT0428 TaxID=2807673 RepID=UPI001BAAC660|nr:aldehyde dehydrogenase family protein [Bradyrhizobium sp. JYMT SZCCT0428]MBR1149425.1 aldehyde dehydrogenase family protein [Bradyrhizobium sp. JYMT SZCCT0428]
MNIASDFKVQRPAFLSEHPKELFIDGKWTPAISGETFETINPSNGQVLARIAAGAAPDVAMAASAARRAFEGPWSHFTPYERQACILKLADLVDRHFDELSLLDSLEMGAPLSRLRANSHKRAIGRLRFYAGLATAIHGQTIENSASREMFTYTAREPIGVVGAIIPWNAPLTSAIWKIGPALATGCTVVLKPAEQASLSCLRLAELIIEAGVPSGVVNVITGFGESAGAALAQHADVDKIAFTGSHFVGQKIIQASAGNLKRVTLELGGKSPDIVFADADLDKAVMGAAMGVFGNTGQVCCAGTRLFVERSIYDEFIARVAKFGSDLVVGDGLDPKTQIGPVVSKEQLDRILSYIQIGLDEGATTLSGGKRMLDAPLANGYFLPPTVFGSVKDDMRIVREEIFGPVVCAIPFDTMDEVERRANATPFGLGSGIWTRDVKKVHRLAKSIKAGSVWVNCYNVMDPAVPFGGNKLSGYGREGGVEHVDDYLNTKSVWINYN